MTPHEFLHVLVDALVERLQEREHVGIPGFGCLRPDPARSGAIEFIPGDSAELDAAVMTLAQAISRRTGHDVASAAVGLSRFSTSARRFIEDHGRLELPGIGEFHGPLEAPGFDPAVELMMALGWDLNLAQVVGLSERPIPPSATIDVAPAESGPAPAETILGHVALDAAVDSARLDAPMESAISEMEPASDAQNLPPEVLDAVIEQANLPPLPQPPPRMRRPDRRRPAGGFSPALIGGLAIIVTLTILFVLVTRRSTPIPTAIPAPADSSAALAGRTDRSSTDSTNGATRDSTLVGAVLTAPTVNNLPVASNSPAALQQPARREPAAGETQPAAGVTRPVAGSGAFDTTRPGFTLITASTTSADEARRSAESVRSLGHPVAVLAYEESGRTRFRIGIGVFPSISAADSVRIALADRLPTGTWIRRIRP